ncbi:hypothetical protein PRK78_004476 [Emydomyces testavorans]|uniref:RING-type E3 ubiquitin transferase n=1 Tax=Emydomyces testavorans TaxID=2070801 RepID=A0AAF0IJ98_9EURO|nr:hypothetical protein PRK78_004476 [Emydomyces testavorans]
MSSPTNLSSSTSLRGDETQPSNGAQGAASGMRTETGLASMGAVPVVDLTRDSPEPNSATVEHGNGASSRSDSEGQTWSEFLQQHPPGEEGANNSNSGSSRGTNRKRRLGSGAGESEPDRIRSSIAGGPASSGSGLGLVRGDSWRGGNSGLSTASPDNAVNALRSSSAVSRQLNSLRHQERSFTDYTLPRWQPDAEVSHCPICGTGFSFWFRKHHCRKCGRVVCASCSPHRITIPRQFIVRPPESRRPLSTIGHPYPSVAEVINLIDGEEEDATQPASHSRPREQQNQFPNPALGGGEEVRLCNPCVPDPNPEPPRRYSTMGSFGYERSIGTANNGHPSPFGSSSLQGSETYDYLPSFRKPSASFEPTSFVDSQPPQDLRGHRPRGMIVSRDSDPQQGLGFPSSRSLFHHRTQSHQRNPYHRDDSNRPLPSPPRRYRHQRVDESDLCPICNQTFPPCGPSRNEEAREAHIRACIQSHQRGHGETSDLPSSPIPGSGQMVHFKATEKDCIGQDGGAPECTICMEEYEVGVELTRLLCFCKFHKSCIIGWFKRKQECPVHKVLA